MSLLDGHYEEEEEEEESQQSKRRKTTDEEKKKKEEDFSFPFLTRSSSSSSSSSSCTNSSSVKSKIPLASFSLSSLFELAPPLCSSSFSSSPPPSSSSPSSSPSPAIEKKTTAPPSRTSSFPTTRSSLVSFPPPHQQMEEQEKSKRLLPHTSDDTQHLLMGLSTLGRKERRELTSVSVPTIHAKDLTDPLWRDGSEAVAAQLLEAEGIAKPTIGAIDPKVWSAEVGGVVQSSLVIGHAMKRKHQINWLAQEARDKEFELLERTRHTRLSKYQTQMKYGW